MFERCRRKKGHSTCIYMYYDTLYMYIHTVVNQHLYNTLYFTFDSQCNGMPMPWSHVEKLYKEDTRADLTTSGLHLVPKLKFEHIYLSSFSKMRVDLAAQVCAVHLHRDTSSM